MNHEWKLIGQPWTETSKYSMEEVAATTTLFSWKCAGCGVEVITSADMNVGSHGSWVYQPTSVRLKQIGIFEDCRDQLCRSVIET